MAGELTIEKRDQKLTPKSLFHVVDKDGETLGSWTTLKGAEAYREFLETYGVKDADTFKEFTGVDMRENSHAG